MIEFYLEIRFVHIVTVLASGASFLIRGLAHFAGARWATAAALRYLGYSIDTVLLTTAMMLMTIVQQYPIVDAWLTVKVLLVVVYIVLGILAFWKEIAHCGQFGCWLAALAVYGYIFSVARAHDPFGFLSGLLR